MRLATWNINGLKARFDYLVHWLRDVQPDIVGLQELKATDDQVPLLPLRELGYHAVTHGQKSWNGVAVLSREPAEVVQVGLPGHEAQGARLLAARAGGMTFMTVYVPNGKTIEHEDFGHKLAWLDALADHIGSRHRPDEPIVLCGDFNVVPAGIDSWDEERHAGGIFHTDDERSRIRALLDWGMVDTWRAQHPEDPGFTWWDYRAGAFHKQQGLRIDLMLATRSVADRLQGATVERRWRKKVEGLTPSDHAPVWIDLA